MVSKACSINQWYICQVYVSYILPFVPSHTKNIRIMHFKRNKTDKNWGHGRILGVIKVQICIESTVLINVSRNPLTKFGVNEWYVMKIRLFWRLLWLIFFFKTLSSKKATLNSYSGTEWQLHRDNPTTTPRIIDWLHVTQYTWTVNDFNLWFLISLIINEYRWKIWGLLMVNYYY